MSLSKKIGLSFFFLTLFVSFISGFVRYDYTKNLLIQERKEAYEGVLNSYSIVISQEFLRLDAELKKRNIQQSLRALLKKNKHIKRAYVYDNKKVLLSKVEEFSSTQPLKRDLVEFSTISNKNNELIIAQKVTLNSGKKKLTLGWLYFVYDLSSVNITVNQMLKTFAIGTLISTFFMIFLIVLILNVGMRTIRKIGEASVCIADGDFSKKIEGSYNTNTPIGALVHAFNRMTTVISASFRFSNKALMKKIINNETTESGQLVDLTIMFGDAVSYTTWSLNKSPNEIFSTLNSYYEVMARIIVEEFGGVVDKFIGDGIMSHFGFMDHDKDHKTKAVKSVIYIQNALKVLVYAIETFEGIEALQYRFGIASGRCLIGAIGSKSVMLDYSLIGANVNLASRIEGVAKPGGIAADFFTTSEVDHLVNTESAGQQKLKGIVDSEGNPIPIKIFHISSFVSEKDKEEMISFLSDKLFTEEFIRNILSVQNTERIKKIREYIKSL